MEDRSKPTFTEFTTPCKFCYNNPCSCNKYYYWKQENSFNIQESKRLIECPECHKWFKPRKPTHNLCSRNCVNDKKEREYRESIENEKTLEKLRQEKIKIKENIEKEKVKQYEYIASHSFYLGPEIRYLKETVESLSNRIDSLEEELEVYKIKNQEFLDEIDRRLKELELKINNIESEKNI